MALKGSRSRTVAHTARPNRAPAEVVKGPSALGEYSDHSLRTLLRAIPDLIWLKDAQGVYLACNHRFEKFFGATEEEIVGKTDYDFVSKELADSFREHDRAAMVKGSASVNEEWVTFADGHRELLETTKTPLLDGQGGLIGVLGVSHDITHRKRAEQYESFRSSTLELLTGETALPEVLEAIVKGVERLHPDMLCSILLLDDEGKHLQGGIAPSLPAFYNAAIDGAAIGPGVGSCGTAAFTGQRVIVDDIATHPYWSVFKELAASAGLGACWSQPILSSTHRVVGTFAIYHRKKHVPAESDIYIIEQSARLASIAIERKQMEERVRHLAFHDTLTGLPNRQLFHDRLEQTLAACIRNGRYAGLLFLDLDNFKPLNDEYGHGAGDLLLKESARRLVECVRKVDTVARFGGDEFVVVLSDLAADKAESAGKVAAVAEKIRNALALPFVLELRDEGHANTTISHHCTASIGAVLFNGKNGNLTDIVKSADLAMYEAKAAGRNKIKILDTPDR